MYWWLLTVSRCIQCCCQLGRTRQKRPRDYYNYDNVVMVYGCEKNSFCTSTCTHVNTNEKVMAIVGIIHLKTSPRQRFHHFFYCDLNAPIVLLPGFSLTIISDFRQIVNNRRLLLCLSLFDNISHHYTELKFRVAACVRSKIIGQKFMGLLRVN